MDAIKINVNKQMDGYSFNVAIPEVDIGDDIFVVQDDNGTIRRVQVSCQT